ncbi:MAG: deoxyguanosinetriphosphate triphosphohydrolase [Deltaproteobacteria bacterium]|nr:deoxyguanosinetriphosphate triphosphohydrolase [Deltaproteobacteria bacterium]
MSIREDVERREQDALSPLACLSSDSKGRVMPEAPCPIRTVFQRDRDRIVYCTAFRRLKHKTQVFLAPMGDHYRTRLTHTLEVSEIARVIARSLRLNEDLAEAVALGHDLGHTPFGHGGETILNEIYPEGFRHSEQSLRVIDVLENKGRGLNLTHEVRDGILKHSKGYGEVIPDDLNELAMTMEGRVVRVADIMAYLNHDLDDAIRSGVIRERDIPSVCTNILGHDHSSRITTMVRDLISTSVIEEDRIHLQFSEVVFEAMTHLRLFLYNNVYRSERVHREFVKAKRVLADLYYYFLDNQDYLKQKFLEMEMGEIPPEISLERRVCDFMASITDRYALSLYEKVFLPSPLV